MKTNPEHLAFAQKIVDEFYGRKLKDGFDNVWAIKFAFGEEFKEYPRIQTVTFMDGMFFPEVWVYTSNHPENEEKDWDGSKLQISRRDFKRLFKMASNASSAFAASAAKKNAERIKKELGVAISNFHLELKDVD